MISSMTEESTIVYGEPLDDGFHVIDYATDRDFSHHRVKNGNVPCPPERLNDKDDWVLDLNRNHPRYNYVRGILLQALNGYGWYYGVPHAIYTRVESPEFVKKIGRRLQKWALCFPRWLHWTGMEGKLRDWATAILTTHDKPIEIRRGYVFHDLDILPYGPGSGALVDADQAKSRHDIYRDALDQMRATFNAKQLEGSDLAPMPGQGTMLIHIIGETEKKLRRLHGLTTGS